MSQRYTAQEREYLEELLKQEELPKQEERSDPKFVKRHYSQIDNAIQKEAEIRDKIKKECASYESAKSHELRKKKVGLFIAWLVLIALLVAIGFYVFSLQNALISAIVAIAIVSFVAVWISTLLTKKHEGVVQYFRETKEMHANWEVKSVYWNLLNGIVIRPFLGIPEDISFVDGQPSDVTESSPSTRPYGTFNRYVSLNCGKCFHTVEGCSGARFPINALELSYNDYKIGHRYYTPCGVCVKSWNSTIIVPEWYTYYVKVKNIADKYDIKILFGNEKEQSKKDYDNWIKNIMI